MSNDEAMDEALETLAKRQAARSITDEHEVLAVARSGAKAVATEALFTLDDRPESRWSAARKELELVGHRAEPTIEYVAAARVASTETDLLGRTPTRSGCVRLGRCARLCLSEGLLGCDIALEAGRICGILSFILAICRYVNNLPMRLTEPALRTNTTPEAHCERTERHNGAHLSFGALVGGYGALIGADQPSDACCKDQLPTITTDHGRRCQQLAHAAAGRHHPWSTWPGLHAAVAPAFPARDLCSVDCGA